MKSKKYIALSLLICALALLMLSGCNGAEDRVSSTEETELAVTTEGESGTVASSEETTPTYPADTAACETEAVTYEAGSTVSQAVTVIESLAETEAETTAENTTEAPQSQGGIVLPDDNWE